MNKQKLIEQLKVHEGVVLKPYECTAGKLTIGIGRNIEDNGITEQEAEILASNDVDYFYDKVCDLYGNALIGVESARVNVLVNMAFNLGMPRFEKFVKLQNAIAVKDYEQAAKEMLDSKWAKQVGNRAEVLAKQMILGEYQ